MEAPVEVGALIATNREMTGASYVNEAAVVPTNEDSVVTTRSPAPPVVSGGTQSIFVDVIQEVVAQTEDPTCAVTV
jgi:hypothetical protein